MLSKKMSALEIKGGLIDLISSINDKDTLSEIQKLIAGVINESLDDQNLEGKLSQSQLKELELSIEESEKIENLVSHEIVSAKYAKWLKK